LTGFTNREKTAFTVQTFKEDVPKVVDILSDMVNNFDFKQEQIEKTRTLINKEQSEIEQNKLDQVVLDHVHAAAYQGSSYATTSLGEPSIVKNIQNADLVKFAQKHYNYQNMVLVGTGAVNHDELVTLAKKSFTKPSSKPIEPLGPIDYVGCEIRIRDDTIYPIRVAFTFEAVGKSDPHYWAFLLLKTILSSWSHNSGISNYQSSRLAEIVATENLAYFYRTFYIPYNNTGLFGIYGETSPHQLDDYTYEVFHEFQKLATYINEQELARAKNQLKSELLSRLEDPTNLAHEIGGNVLSSSRALSIAEQFKRINDIDIADVLYILNNYFTDVDPVVIGHGPIDELPDYNIIRNWTYWNRW